MVAQVLGSAWENSRRSPNEASNNRCLTGLRDNASKSVTRSGYLCLLEGGTQPGLMPLVEP